MANSIPDSLVTIIAAFPAYGRCALDKWIQINSEGADLYDDLIAKYDAANEEDLHPEFAARRQAHLNELVSIRDRFRDAADAGIVYRDGLPKNDD